MIFDISRCRCLEVEVDGVRGRLGFPEIVLSGFAVPLPMICHLIRRVPLDRTGLVTSRNTNSTMGSTQAGHKHGACGAVCELKSKLLESLLISLIVIPYIVPYVTPSEEFRLGLVWLLCMEPTASPQGLLLPLRV